MKNVLSIKNCTFQIHQEKGRGLLSGPQHRTLHLELRPLAPGFRCQISAVMFLGPIFVGFIKQSGKRLAGLVSSYSRQMETVIMTIVSR